MVLALREFWDCKKTALRKICILCIVSNIFFFLAFSGCFCVFSDGFSLEYIRDSLEKTLLSNLEQDDRLPFQGLPLVIVLAASSNLPEKELLRLKEEGANLAVSLQCPFLDVTSASNSDPQPGGAAGSNEPDSVFDREHTEEALRALIENIRHRSGLLKICKQSNSAAGNTAPSGGTNNSEPDIR